MRHGTTNRRQRSRGNGNGNGNGGRRGNQGRTQVFDSNGPDVRIRGTAHQVAEKYEALAKDATSVGDIIMAESYLQHAEHYRRTVNIWSEDNKDRNDQASRARSSDSTTRTPKDNSKPEGESDLSLPASILGEKANVDSEKKEKELTPAS